MASSFANSIVRIPPYSYIHVLDQNTNISKLVIGPKIFVKQDNEKVIFGPDKMITIPPRYFCLIENPLINNKDGRIEYDDNGQAQ